jgi:hypothetical protein
MTKSELIEKLQMAQRLLDDVYYWANYKEGESVLPRNETVRDSMSVADCAIYDALEALED